MSDGVYLHWWSAQPGDPWALLEARLGIAAMPVAIADRVIAGAQDASLALSTGKATHYLGYRNLGIGTVSAIGPFAALAIGPDVIWLDRKLRATRRFDGPVDAIQVFAVDSRHVVQVARVADEVAAPATPISPPPRPKPWTRAKVTLVDIENRKEHVLGTWERTPVLDYDEDTRVLALTVDRRVDRFHLDLANNRAEPMQALATTTAAVAIAADPKTAVGVVAITYAVLPEGAYTLGFFEEKPMDVPVRAVSTIRTANGSMLLGFDNTGRGYFASGLEIVAYSEGREPERIPAREHPQIGAVSADGQSLVYLGTSEIVAIDRNGAERWRVPAWRVNELHFANDQRTVLVSTQGGLLALDGATGNRIANGRGWGFGLATEHVSAVTFNAPNVCAEGGP
jgi:hypothetical protein